MQKSYDQIDLLRDRRRQLQRLMRLIYAQQALGMRPQGIDRLLDALRTAIQAYNLRARELGAAPLKSGKRSHYRTKHDHAKLLMPTRRRLAYATIIQQWFRIVDQAIKHDAALFPADMPSNVQWQRGIRSAWRWLYNLKSKLTAEVAG